MLDGTRHVHMVKFMWPFCNMKCETFHNVGHLVNLKHVRYLFYISKNLESLEMNARVSRTLFIFNCPLYFSTSKHNGYLFFFNPTLLLKLGSFYFVKYVDPNSSIGVPIFFQNHEPEHWRRIHGRSGK